MLMWQFVYVFGVTSTGFELPQASRFIDYTTIYLITCIKHISYNAYLITYMHICDIYYDLYYTSHI